MTWGDLNRCDAEVNNGSVQHLPQRPLAPPRPPSPELLRSPLDPPGDMPSRRYSSSVPFPPTLVILPFILRLVVYHPTCFDFFQSFFCFPSWLCTCCRPSPICKSGETTITCRLQSSNMKHDRVSFLEADESFSVIENLILEIAVSDTY
jgi:hypothetical protein